MSKPALLGSWVKRFLLDHLIEERNLSRNTQRSYRDTLALLLPYASAQKKTPVNRLDIFDLSSDILRRFLDHVEQERRCSIRTRNQRLAAVHAMARFIAERSPEHIAWCSQIRGVPFKRFTRNELSYLDKTEMEHCWPLPIAARNKAFAIMRSSCFSITPALVSPRPHRSRSAISTCVPTKSATYNSGARDARCVVARFGQHRYRAARPHSQPRSRSARLSQPARPGNHPSWHPLDAPQPCPHGSSFTAISAWQSNQPAHHQAYDSHAPAALRRRYQHHPRLARPCLHRHNQHLCRS